jgi:hypothetical protein
MLRSSLYTAGALLICTSAFAQQVQERNLQHRVLPVTAPIHQLEGRLDLRTGKFVRTPGQIGDSAQEKVYDNTCILGRTALFTTTQSGGINGEAMGDWGAIPATSFPGDTFCTVGCANAYDITQFQIGWCIQSSPSTGGTMELHFWQTPQQSCQFGLGVNSTPIQGQRPPATTTILSATITGLPRAASPGALACYTLNIGLVTPGFSINGSSTFTPGISAGDKFAWSMAIPSNTGGDGPLLSGNLSLGTPCAPCVGTLWQAGGQTTNAGTGGGQDAHVFFEEYGGTAIQSGDCYFFGGPAPSGMHLNLFATKPCLTGPVTTSFCDASDGSLASCPCANPGNPDTGCDAAIPAMQGGGLTGGLLLTVVAQETTPTNRATVTGTGYPSASTPGAVVIRANNLDTGTPVVFGDGLRCIGVPLTRLGAAAAAGGVSTHVFGHGTMAGTGVRYYQIWYRHQPISYCDPLAGYNLSQGQTLTW